VLLLLRQKSSVRGELITVFGKSAREQRQKADGYIPDTSLPSTV